MKPLTRQNDNAISSRHVLWAQLDVPTRCGLDVIPDDDDNDDDLCDANAWPVNTFNHPSVFYRAYDLLQFRARCAIDNGAVIVHCYCE